MASERIDHAAEAWSLLERARVNSREDVTVAAAQVHATLAVAEQLRAANVIAYVAAASSMSDGHKTWVEQEMGL